MRQKHAFERGARGTSCTTLRGGINELLSHKQCRIMLLGCLSQTHAVLSRNAHRVHVSKPSKVFLTRFQCCDIDTLFPTSVIIRQGSPEAGHGNRMLAIIAALGMGMPSMAISKMSASEREPCVVYCKGYGVLPTRRLNIHE